MFLSKFTFYLKDTFLHFILCRLIKKSFYFGSIIKYILGSLCLVFFLGAFVLLNWDAAQFVFKDKRPAAL